jgi:hypothetical protein
MNAAVRRLTVIAAALATPLVAALVAAPAAVAGGAPDYPVGAVSLAPRAVLEGDTLTLRGTYWCQGAGERVGFFYGDLYGRSGAAVPFELGGLTCDGATHDWQVKLPAGQVQLGRAWAHGMIQVCESADGPCPGALFDETLAVRPA